MIRALVDRVRGLLVAPRAELTTTLAEPGDLRSVLVRHVLPLAAVGPVARFLSGGVIGTYYPPTNIFNTVIPGGWLRAPGVALVDALIVLAVGVTAWLYLAVLLARLAPSFGGLPDPKGANRAAACILTPIWAAGALLLLESVPHLGWLWQMGLVAGLAHGVYIGRRALPLLLGTPDERAAGHALMALGLTVLGAACTYSLASLATGSFSSGRSS